MKSSYDADVDALSILFRDATGCEMGSLLDLPLKKRVLCRRTGIHHVV
jgi:hypothetical protein